MMKYIIGGIVGVGAIVGLGVVAYNRTKKKEAQEAYAEVVSAGVAQVKAGIDRDELAKVVPFVKKADKKAVALNNTDAVVEAVAGAAEKVKEEQKDSKTTSPVMHALMGAAAGRAKKDLKARNKNRI
jgi:hypothetical protein|nr:MAG TPA: Cell-membrane associated Mucin15 [Caudoviricetes sp.]